MVLLAMLAFVAIVIGIWSTLAYVILLGFEALGVVTASWQAAIGMGLLMAFIASLFNRTKE